MLSNPRLKTPKKTRFFDRGENYCVHAMIKTPQGPVTGILAPQG
jgi:hypothetical protein